MSQSLGSAAKLLQEVCEVRSTWWASQRAIYIEMRPARNQVVERT